MFVLGMLLFLIGIVATLALKHYMGGTDAYELQRAAKRIEARQAIEGEAKKLLHTNEWVDQGKGVIRLPIEQAMAMEIAAIKAEPPRPAAYTVGAAVPIPASAQPAKPAAAPIPAAKGAVKPAPATGTSSAPTATASAPAAPAAAPAPTSPK